MNNNLILLKDISFGYKPNKLNIEKLDININEYGIYGLLGHNGAGKTTLFKILLGLITPSSGEVKYNKSELYNEKQLSIVYMPENNGLYKDLTIKQNLTFRGMANGLDKKEIEEKSEKLLKKFSLTNKKNEKISSLSSGMKKKVALIATLVISPKIILLDEPTNGVDPESLLDIIDIINMLQEEKCIVIISSHDLDFIQKVAKYIYILEDGYIVYAGEYFDEENTSLLDTYMNKLKKYREGKTEFGKVD